MLYKERLQRLVKSEDPFWIDTIARFIEATYESKEQGISELEELAKDRTRFNEFTKQIVKRKDDLKSVKAEFLEDINNNYIKNINSIAEKIVEKIQKLDDNEVASITTLLDGNKYDPKTMFDIYDTTVKKLKEVGLYLDFGQYANQRVGLPFNIPFKKGYMNAMEYEEKEYSKMPNDEELRKAVQEIVDNNNPFENEQVLLIIREIVDLPYETETTIAKLINYNPEKNNIDPLTQGEIENLVEEICKKINIKLELKRDCFGGLAYYYSFKKVRSFAVRDGYIQDTELKNLPFKKEYASNTKSTEKCLCGNILEIEWSKDQKFQMVRCPKCNNEMKFKNPNLN